jgi:hypothetical protein
VAGDNRVSQEKALAELRSLVQRAKSGDRAALPRLRQYLSANPTLWKGPGNVALQAQAAWINLIAGPNLHFRECVARQINEMKQDLAGPSPSPLEAMLIERLITSWLQLGYLEAREAQVDEKSEKWFALKMQRQALAERQFRGAMHALVTLRQLSAKPITVELHQHPVPATPIEKIVSSPLNGEQPARINGKGKRAKNGAVNGTSKSSNGHNGMNGNRVAHLLGTAAADTSE